MDENWNVVNGMKRVKWYIMWVNQIRFVVSDWNKVSYPSFQRSQLALSVKLSKDSVFEYITKLKGKKNLAKEKLIGRWRKLRPIPCALNLHCSIVFFYICLYLWWSVSIYMHMFNAGSSLIKVTKTGKRIFLLTTVKKWNKLHPTSLTYTRKWNGYTTPGSFVSDGIHLSQGRTLN